MGAPPPQGIAYDEWEASQQYPTDPLHPPPLQDPGIVVGEGVHPSTIREATYIQDDGSWYIPGTNPNGQFGGGYLNAVPPDEIPPMDDETRRQTLGGLYGGTPY